MNYDVNEYDRILPYLAMNFFGVGGVLGSFFIGFIVDKFGSKDAVMFNVSICFVMTLITVTFCLADWKMSLACLMCFLWGF
jgi:predicted MFS family arabinose efflux permease